MRAHRELGHGTLRDRDQDGLVRRGRPQGAARAPTRLDRLRQGGGDGRPALRAAVRRAAHHHPLRGGEGQDFYTAYQGNIYGIAVPADSPIKDAKELKGKKIGVQSMSSAGVQVARALLGMYGIDPDKEAQIVVVGEAGQAAALVRSKQVDALSLYDVQYALIENAGQPLRLLDTGPIAKYPSNGFLALEATLKENRAQAVGLAKGYARGTIFAMNNPEAAVRILYEVYPQTKPTGKSEADAVRDDVKALEARIAHWRLEAGGVTHWGESPVEDYAAYEAFLLKNGVVKVEVPASELVTNDLVDEINGFDAAKIAAEAKVYKAN